jgi:hypothetical protein
VVPGDDEVLDGAQEVTTSLVVRSLVSRASCNGDGMWLELDGPTVRCWTRRSVASTERGGRRWSYHGIREIEASLVARLWTMMRSKATRIIHRSSSCGRVASVMAVCSNPQENDDQNLSVGCTGARGDELCWLEDKGERELTGIVVDNRRCLRDWDLDCEQPSGATSRVLGGGHAQNRGGFIGAILWPRVKGIMPDSERDPRGSSRLAMFVPDSLAGMTCGVALSASEEKKRITVRGGKG